MNTRTTQPRFSLFEGLSRGLNQLVHEVLHHDGKRFGFLPASVFEFDNHYVVECDVPGVKESDIEVSLTDGVLNISAERGESFGDDVKVVLNERSFRKTGRKIQLGTDVNPDSVDAELGDGVLTVTVHKSESVLPRTIQIRKAKKPEGE